MGKRQRNSLREVWVGQHTRFHTSPHSVPRSTSPGQLNTFLSSSLPSVTLNMITHSSSFRGAATVTRSQRERRKARRERKDKFIKPRMNDLPVSLSPERCKVGTWLFRSRGEGLHIFLPSSVLVCLSCHVNMLYVLPSLASAPCVLISV